MKNTILLGLLLIIMQPVHATLPVFDVDLFTFSDNFNYSGTKSNTSRTFWDIYAGMPLASKSSWVLGWNYDAMKFSDNPGTVSTTLSISEMGPKLVWTANKERTISLGLVYNLIARGNYNPGTTTQLRGTSYRVEFAYQPAITDNLFIGLKLNYYHATFNEEVIQETTLAKPSDSRGAIYPTLAFTYRFD